MISATVQKRLLHVDWHVYCRAARSACGQECTPLFVKLSACGQADKIGFGIRCFRFGSRVSCFQISGHHIPCFIRVVSVRLVAENAPCLVRASIHNKESHCYKAATAVEIRARKTSRTDDRVRRSALLVTPRIRTERDKPLLRVGRDMYINVYVHIYTYIYREREIHIAIYVYVCIYI